MSEPDLNIRQMCERFEVTARTLRFYESKELLFPTRIGQKRLYGVSDCARLTLILRGKRFGFSLEEIRQLLDLYNKDDQNLEQLSKTYEIATARLDDLKSRRCELDDAIADLEHRLSEGADMITVLKQQTAKT